MIDRREEKTRRGVEAYKAFYPAFTEEEIERLIQVFVGMGERRRTAKWCTDLYTTGSGYGWCRYLLKAGIACRVCGDTADAFAYARPYCQAHMMRGVYGKIGKCSYGVVAQ